MESLLAREGLDVNNVQDWGGRPKRTRRRPPPSYWEEYVETDQWYLNALLEDVPADEMHAACHDEDFADDDAAEEDESDSELEEEGEDCDYEPPLSECEVSDGLYYEDEGESEYAASGADSEEEEVLWTSEGERGSEEAHGEGPRRAMG